MSLLKDFIIDFLPGGGKYYRLGVRIWNACVELLLSLMGITPQTLGGGSIWEYVSGNLFNLYLTIGMSLMTLYWLINFCKENANLREKLTLEKTFVSLLRLIVGNIVLANLLRYIGVFFNMASGLSSTTLDLSIQEMDIHDPDFSEALSYFIFGFLFLLVAIVCGLLLILSVYRRFLTLYMVVPMGPVALSGVAGGRGIDSTAWAWIRTFMSLTFEIVVIALALSIGQMMLNSGATDLIFDGDSLISNFTEPWEAMFTMVLTCSSVKAAESLLRRAFGL